MVGIWKFKINASAAFDIDCFDMWSVFPHPTWKSLKTWNFVIFFSRPGKCLEFAQKVLKTWNFNSKPGKNMKFANSMFQTSLFKVSFTKIILIYFFVMSTLSAQTLVRSQINLWFHCFYLVITWKMHWILCHKRSGNPASVLTHFEIFIIKICMKVPGIWHKKPWKTWNLGPKTLREPGIWNWKISGNPGDKQTESLHQKERKYKLSQ